MAGQDKTPGLINWTFYLALTLLVVLPLSVLTVRSGAWQQGLLLYATACVGSAVLVVLSLILLLLPRFSAWRKAIVLRALPALPGTAILIMLFSGTPVPRIHDITTDTADPPIFSKAAELRGENANPLQIDQEVIALQQEGYPDLETLTTDQPFDAAYSRAVQVATELGWEIYHEDRNAGVIEAVDTTAVMGFKDDIVVRLRTNAQGTLVDLRSVSRVGQSDIGANAQRIRTFIEAFKQQG
jgi:uncharacterized protein DUF1499